MPEVQCRDSALQRVQGKGEQVFVQGMRVYRAMRKVLVTGSFELLHPGHVSLFKQAKELGDFLVVVIARDATIRKERGREPIMGEKQRLEMVSCLKVVDEARLGNEGYKYKVLGEERPQVVLLGYDQVVDEEALAEECAKVGAVLKRARPLNQEEFKSSLLAKKIGV